MTQSKPLVLDVDGTLLKTSLSSESFWSALRQAPLAVLGALLAHPGRPAARRQAIARAAPLRTDLLPLRDDVVAIAQAAYETGSDVVLTSSADAGLVAQLAEDQGVTGLSFGSDGQTLLSGKAKSAALMAAYGRGGFHFAGKDARDRPVWEAADGCILVGAMGGLAEDLKQDGKDVSELPGGWRGLHLLRALRPQRWVRALLMLLPLLALLLPFAGAVPDSAMVLTVAGGVLAFVAIAAGLAMFADLPDLEADRLHPRKFRRPFASGAVPLRAGAVTAVLLLLAGLTGAGLLSLPFLSYMGGYVALSVLWALWLKRLRWVDLFILAALDTVLIFAGASLVGTALSLPLLTWCFPVLVLFAVVTRLGALGEADDAGEVPGQPYTAPDRTDLRNLGWLAAAAALGGYTTFILSDAALLQAPLRWALWLGLPVLALWLGRMIGLGQAAPEQQEPLGLALSDLRSLALLAVMLGLFLAAGGTFQGLTGG